MSNISTAERLENYYPGFSPDVVDVVSDFADYQASFEDYRDFFGAVGIPDVETVTFDGNTGVTVVDVRPEDYDAKHAIIMHLPMGNPLDTNQLFQVATVAGTNPDSRVIAFGNPSSGRYKGQTLPREHKKQIVSGLLSPLVRDGNKYIENSGIELTDEAGYSFGALKVLASAYAGTHLMRHVVSVEPVGKKRNLAKLTYDFIKSNKALGQYTKAPELPIYTQARDDAVSDLEYFKGLARPTNIAIARALSNSGLYSHMFDTLFFNPGSDLTVAWGSESELSNDDRMTKLVNDLKKTSEGHRVSSMRLEGQKHALANDIHLHAAIIKQALSK